MKILNAFYFKPQNYSFKRTVDYGAKDKNLVYVPILFEENDTFQTSTNQETQNTSTDNTNPNKPKKIGTGTILTAGGGIVAAVEVVPETINNMINKTADVAKNSMKQIDSVKETYKETFQKSSQKSEQAEQPVSHHQEDDDNDPYQALGHKTEETNTADNHPDIDTDSYIDEDNDTTEDNSHEDNYDYDYESYD